MKLLVILVTCNIMLYLVEIKTYKSCSFSMKWARPVYLGCGKIEFEWFEINKLHRKVLTLPAAPTVSMESRSFQNEFFIFRWFIECELITKKRLHAKLTVKDDTFITSMDTTQTTRTHKRRAQLVHEREVTVLLSRFRLVHEDPIRERQILDVVTSLFTCSVYLASDTILLLIQ